MIIMTITKQKFNLKKARKLKLNHFKEKIVKFLHTSDWHLGAKTNGKDRLTEQKRVLDEILSIANYESVDCVIIAGDIFNTANPSAEAEELFFDIVEKLSAKGDRFVFVLPGNHDDPTRLSAGLPLAEKHNIALVGSLEKLKQSGFDKNALVKVIETGKGYLRLQKNEEIVTIAYLPYPSEARISEKIESDGDGELSYAEKVRKWANIGASAFVKDSFNIFVSHLFLVGAKTNDSTVKVGDILAVPANFLPKANYTALGHIHTKQEIAENVFYSGAIARFSVGQKEPAVMVFESENGKLSSVSETKLNSPARYEKVSASSLEDAKEKLANFDDRDIVELEILTNGILPSSEIKSLKKTFACLSNISLVREFFDAGGSAKSTRKHLSDEELFKQFYASVRGSEPSEDLVKMFIDCKGDSHETY